MTVYSIKERYKMLQLFKLYFIKNIKIYF